MERMISGRVGLACISFCFTLHVCLATVLVTVTPEIDVIIGKTARLPCSYTTTSTSPMVQWFIEFKGGRKRVAFKLPERSDVDKDSPLAGRVSMENDTLVISAVKVTDERSYFCQVDEGPTGSSEAETKLRVFFAPEKPVVSENNQVMFLSEDSSLAQVGKCTSSNGHPRPRIIWFKDFNPLPEVKNQKNKSHYMVEGIVTESSGLYTVSNTLYITPERTDDKSLFHCTVEYSMPNGEMKKENSAPFNITLYYPSEKVFFKLLNMSPIKEGDDVQMKCETDGNPQPQFELTKPDTTHKTGHGLFILNNVSRNDSGIYTCIAQDFDTTDELIETLSINVHYLDPVSVVPSKTLHVNKGEAIEFQCHTKSSDGFILSWMKDGKQLSQKGVLNVESAALDNAGVYVCNASVPTVPGLWKQTNVSVIISGQPEIEEPMTGTVAKQGDEVTLKCSARGHPKPQFTWKPSGKVSLDINGNKYTSTVKLPATTDVIQNGVTCEATNVHGTASARLMVKIQSGNTIEPNTSPEAGSQQGGSKGVVVAVLVCVLLLLLLVAVLYFLSTRGMKVCRKKEKEPTPGEEMKPNEKPNEGSGLLKEQV